MCATYRTRVFYVLSILVSAAAFGQAQEQTPEFAPTVTATCKTGRMAVRVQFPQSFNGVVHARAARKSGCLAYGNGTDSVAFDIDLMAAVGSPDYCGIIVNNRTDEKSVSLAVRAHRTLELAEDKYYVITCGKSGIQNSRNETSLVSLRVMNENGHKVTNALFGKAYILRADLSKPDSMHGIRMKTCFAFNKKNTNVTLIDNRGCPVSGRVSPVRYSADGAMGEATLYSMFRFPESSQLNFQCDVAICKGVCPEVDCTSESASAGADEVFVLASTGVFVLEPGDSPSVAESCSEGGIHPAWLLYLAIALGVMFLIMLLINCFLCTAMTCSCARTEVLEKDPSVVEDYDPYRSWHGSQYGTRYPSSTIHSARSVSDNSDHYAIVQSRPGSRHSGVHRSRH